MRFLVFVCLLIFISSVKGQVNDTIPSSNKASESNSYFTKGQNEEEKGEYNKAIKDYIKAIELKLDYLEALRSKSIPNTDIQNYRVALSSIKSILKADSSKTDLRVNLKSMLNDLVIVNQDSPEGVSVNSSNVITAKDVRQNYHKMKKAGLIMMFSGTIIGASGFAFANYYAGIINKGNANPSLAGVLPGGGSSPPSSYDVTREAVSIVACGIGIVDLLFGTGLFLNGNAKEKKLNNRITFTSLPNGIRIAYTF